ncbi:MAG: conjugal transfer protein TraD [Sphingobacteriaceae bacterium]|nr:conjugal transfer protein TraD [Sphingobacteriaceae bacterium]
MEILILICLLVVIVLLLQEKGIFATKPAKSFEEKISNTNVPEIMGLPKPVKRLSAPMSANESHLEKQETDPAKFDQEIDAKEVANEIPQEEPADIFVDELDYELEEEEMSRYRISEDESGFAMGVTFEELGAVQMLLQQKEPAPSLQKQAATIVQKIQGTELFSLLENSMEGASKKIAALLDQSFSSSIKSGSSIMRNENLERFDIGDFV